MDTRKYYEAYEDRYRQVHGHGLRWFSSDPSPIVETVIQKFSITHQHRILEVGCGEGRDAIPLLAQGYDLLATDISETAIGFCRETAPQFAPRFQILDCVKGYLESSFDFIYAISLVHMLVEDADRDGFYSFIREHLTDDGIALVCTMGDGEFERKSDITTAFNLQKRVHEASGTVLMLAGTSYRAVSFSTFEQELVRNSLAIIEQGITLIEPDYHQVMYAVVKKGE